VNLAHTALKNLTAAAYPGSVLEKQLVPVIDTFFKFGLSDDATSKTDAYKVLYMQTGLKLLGTNGYHLNMIATKSDTISAFLSTCFTVAVTKDHFYRSSATAIPPAIFIPIVHVAKPSFLEPPKYNTNEFSVKILDLFVSKFVQMDVSKPSLELTLLKDIIFGIMTSHPFLFSSSKFFCSALHQLIDFYSLYDVADGIAKFTASFLKMLKEMENNHVSNYNKPNSKRDKVPAVNHVLCALLDHALDAPNADPVDVALTDDFVFAKREKENLKSLSYERVTLALAGVALTTYPRFAAWYPKCFGRFFFRCVEYQKLEANLMIVPIVGYVCHVADWFVFLFKSGYYTYLQTFDKPSDEDVVYKFLEGLIKEYSTKDSVVRYVTLRFLQVVGLVSQKKVSDNELQWREQFVTLLTVFRNDKEDWIKAIAHRTVTSEPIAFTEASFSAEAAFTAGSAITEPSAVELFGW